jgi:crotonyl-CoA reductase
VNEIRDAILADQPDALAGLPVPESYRAVLVRKDEQQMFAGLPTRRRTPASRCTWRRCPPPSWARARRSWR